MSGAAASLTFVSKNQNFVDLTATSYYSIMVSVISALLSMTAFIEMDSKPDSALKHTMLIVSIFSAADAFSCGVLSAKSAHEAYIFVAIYGNDLLRPSAFVAASVRRAWIFQIKILSL